MGSEKKAAPNITPTLNGPYVVRDLERLSNHWNLGFRDEWN